MMKVRTALMAAVAGCGLAVTSWTATAVPCSAITTIGQWEAAGSCDQSDKVWTIGANTLDDSVQVLFSNPVVSAHVMQIIGFDNSDLAGAWSINYSISVTDPNFFISAMFAGADNPAGGSLLTKDVTGDAAFSLSVVNGVEGPASGRLGLSATTLNIAESFSVNASSNLLSVSNFYIQQQRAIPEPGPLALVGFGMAGLAFLRRRRR